MPEREGEILTGDAWARMLGRLQTDLRRVNSNSSLLPLAVIETVHDGNGGMRVVRLTPELLERYHPSLGKIGRFSRYLIEMMGELDRNGQRGQRVYGFGLNGMNEASTQRQVGVA